MAPRVRVTLVRSLIGSTERQRAIVHSLGLRRINDSTTRERTSGLEGILRRAGHLLRVDPEGSGGSHDG